MSKRTRSSTGPDRASSGEAAAAWVVRMASDQRTRGDVDAFESWLSRDAAHAERYADHAELWQGVAALANNDEARAILGHARPPPEALRPRFHRRRFLGGVAAALAASAAAFVLWPMLSGGGDLYETMPGEQRRLTLADGSSVMLNTASRLRIAFSDSERRLVLDRGQAYFKVAKDARRPFRVFAGDDEVRAIGTAFEVRRDGDRSRITLEEGVVALYRGTADRPATVARGNVRPASAIEQPIAILRPGQQAALTPTAPIAVIEIDVRKTRAWRDGRMILDGALLGETVADLNRYGGKRIVLGDPALAALRISGVFHTAQSGAFVDGVTAALPVRLASQTETTLVLEPR